MRTKGVRQKLFPVAILAQAFGSSLALYRQFVLSAVTMLALRSAAPKWSAPPASLLAWLVDHVFDNDDVEAKVYTTAKLFSPHLEFFGGMTQIAHEAIRGFIMLDEANMCPRSTLSHSRTSSWRTSESPPLDGIPVWLHEQFLNEWLRIPMLHESEYVENAFCDDLTLFHGTIAKSAHMITKIGFLPGPNGHVKNRRYYEGAFMARQFYQACYRSDMTRHVREDDIYDFESCPCVLELRTSSMLVKNYHKHNPDLFVLPGARGRVLQGLRVDAVHFNRRFVQNYLSLHSVDLRRQIVAHGGVEAVACGGGRQFKDFCTCGAVSFNPWHDLKKLGRFYVCHDCYSVWR